MSCVKLLVPAFISLLLAGAALGSELRLERPAEPGCREADFRLRGARGVFSEPTGQHTVALRLRNRGRTACVLYGYPRLELLDRLGTVPFRFSHKGDQVVTARRPTRVLVRPGGSAFVILNKYRCDRGDLRSARSARLAFRRGPVFLETSLLRGWISWCGKGDPGSLVTVSPYEPSIRAGLRH
jgi:Protein of unknown function (DUF4232)